MAQTISLQRGTATVTGDGTSFATLFTNGSTGLGTRVIVNQLQITGNSGTQECYARLFNNGSGTARTILGQAYSFNNIGNGGTLTFYPTQNTFQQNFSNTTANAVQSFGSPVFLSSNPRVSIIASGNQNPNYTLLPTTFWIGPSDAIQMSSYMKYISGKSTPSATVTIAYSFTLITES